MNSSYPVIMLGTDAATVDPSSDTARRMAQYGTLYEKLYIVISGRDALGRNEVQLSENVFVMPATRSLKIVRFFEMFRRAYSLAKQHHIRCFMSQDPFFLGLAAWVLAKKFSGVFSVGVYGTDPANAWFRGESLKHRLYALIARFLFSRTTAIQTDGPETVAHLTQEYGDKVFFKPMIPENLHELSFKARQHNGDILRVLFIGRFTKQKNIPLLASVIKEAHEQMGNAVAFTCVGSGSEHPWFVTFIQTHDLAKSCKIQPHLSREEIVAAMKKHDVLLLVSFYEGFPRVFMEAAAAGMPVVTTEVGGTQGLIINMESGLVLPQGSTASSVAERLHMFVRDRSLYERLSRGIQSRWEQMYGDKTTIDFQKPLAEFLGEKLAL